MCDTILLYMLPVQCGKSQVKDIDRETSVTPGDVQLCMQRPCTLHALLHCSLPKHRRQHIRLAASLHAWVGTCTFRNSML